jgi:predicted double-glycine peptidase
MKKDEGREKRTNATKVIKSFLPPSSFMFLFLAFFLNSCTSTQEITQSRIIENVPFFSQTIYQCGPASLAGVLNYWGVMEDPDEIAGEIYSASARGTLDIDMVLYAQKKGLLAVEYEGNFEDIRKNIDSGRPLIVLVGYGFSIVQKNHFMVIIGYNDNGFIVNSGKSKGKFISEMDLLKSWEKTKFWTLLIKPDE